MNQAIKLSWKVILQVDFKKHCLITGWGRGQLNTLSVFHITTSPYMTRPGVVKQPPVMWKQPTADCFEIILKSQRLLPTTSDKLLQKVQVAVTNKCHAWLCWGGGVEIC